MAKNLHIPLLMICLIPFFSLRASVKSYEMQDLEILEKQKNFQEFLIHALDIRPSKRNRHWSDMVGHMAEGYLVKLLDEKSFNRKDFLFVEKVSEWSPLLNDEFFQLKREDYVKSYLYHCFSSEKKYCIGDLQAFFAKKRKNAQLGFQLGILLRKFDQKADTWSLFKMAAQDKLAEFYCQKEPMQLALVGRIIPFLEKHGLKDQSVIRKKILDIATLACWKKLTALFEGWRESKSHKMREYAYVLLKLSRSLSEEKKDFHLVSYILQGPHKGEVFNEAWNTVRFLGQNFKRRNKLVDSLLKLDPLPDRLFAIKDTQKREIITEFVAKNIPEFFDKYTKICLNYFSGQGTFPKGNPTVHCLEFARQVKGKDWISAKLIPRLREIATLSSKQSKK